MRIYVSSTAEDLTNEREAVLRKIRDLGYEPVGMEHYKADDRMALDRWCHSSGHHRNICRQGWTQIGVGQSTAHWTQMFGR